MELYELFDEVDASQVTILEDYQVDTDRIRELTFSRLPAPKRRITHKFLLAAAILTTLVLTALACEEFIRYQNADTMLDDAFGGESVVDATGPFGALPDQIRVPLDLLTAEKVAPYIASVERTAQIGNRSVTVHGHLYDSVTGGGFLYYTLEDPDGLEGDWDTSVLPVQILNCSSYPRILEQSSDTNLEIVEFYARQPGSQDDCLEVQLIRPGENISSEEEFTQEQNTLRLPLRDGGGMDGLIGQGIRVSPIGIHLDRIEEDQSVACLALHFRDGSEYVVFDREQENFSYAVHFPGAVDIGFNRLVDVDSLEAVEIDGQWVKNLSSLTDHQRLRPAFTPGQKSELDTADTLPGDSLTFGEFTLIPETFRYDPQISSGQLHCRIQVPKDHSDLILDDYFLSEQAGLKASQLGHWYVEEENGRELSVTYTFVSLAHESPNLKLWFDGSNADPRLDHSTENLMVFPFEKTDQVPLALADGAILISDTGMRIDYTSLGIQQGSTPKGLTLQFVDGSNLVISDWDQKILDCLWLNTAELRNSDEQILRISFHNPVDHDRIQSVTYAGETYEMP